MLHTHPLLEDLAELERSIDRVGFNVTEASKENIARVVLAARFYLNIRLKEELDI